MDLLLPGYPPGTLVPHGGHLVIGTLGPFDILPTPFWLDYELCPSLPLHMSQQLAEVF